MKLIERNDISLLRTLREQQCFPIVNRGRLWYETLSLEQLSELRKWYLDWLDVTKTLKVPTTPTWINKTNQEEEIW